MAETDLIVLIVSIVATPIYSIIIALMFYRCLKSNPFLPQNQQKQREREQQINRKNMKLELQMAQVQMNPNVDQLMPANMTQLNQQGLNQNAGQFNDIGQIPPPSAVPPQQQQQPPVIKQNPNQVVAPQLVHRESIEVDVQQRSYQVNKEEEPEERQELSDHSMKWDADVDEEENRHNSISSIRKSARSPENQGEVEQF